MSTDTREQVVIYSIRFGSDYQRWYSPVGVVGTRQANICETHLQVIPTVCQRRLDQATNFLSVALYPTLML